MILSIEQQIRLILVSIISGIVIGLVFDIYKIYRDNKSCNKYIIIFQDIIFWILCAIIVFFITFLMNDAYIGFYGYAIITLSFFLYICTISKMINKVFFKGFICISILVRSIIKCLIYPFYVLAKESINKNTHNNINKRLEKK